MAGGLTGLTGIAYRQYVSDETPQATPEERSGYPADPRHAQPGEQARPYAWESQMTPGGSHGPFGPENQLLGDPEWLWSSAGTADEDPYFDHTPSRRAGPFPKGILSGPIPGATPDDIADQLQQSMAIHGIRTNAGLRVMTSLQDPLQDEWNELYEVNPGYSNLSVLPRQQMSSHFMFGSRDRTQTMSQQNEYGFDSAHMHRRYASGAIPGNTMWLRPGGRPMVKNLAGPARPPIGPDSPFADQDTGAAFSINGAYLQNVPPEYVGPPQPNLASASTTPVPNGDDSVVEWY